MKQSIVLGTFLFLLAALPGCSSNRRGEVVVIGKTGTYHRPDCSLVKMAKTKVVSLAEAKAERLKPCPGCKPDTI